MAGYNVQPTTAPATTTTTQSIQVGTSGNVQNMQPPGPSSQPTGGNASTDTSFEPAAPVLTPAAPGTTAQSIAGAIMQLQNINGGGGTDRQDVANALSNVQSVEGKIIAKAQIKMTQLMEQLKTLDETDAGAQPAILQTIMQMREEQVTMIQMVQSMIDKENQLAQRIAQ